MLSALGLLALLLLPSNAAANEPTLDSLVPDELLLIPPTSAETALLVWPSDLEQPLSRARELVGSNSERSDLLGRYATAQLEHASELRSWLDEVERGLESSPPAATQNSELAGELMGLGDSVLLSDPDLLFATLSSLTGLEENVPPHTRLLDAARLTLEPEDSGRGVLVAWLYLRKGDWQEASEVLNALTPSDADAPRVLFYRAEIAWSRDNGPLALKRYAALTSSLSQQQRLVNLPLPLLEAMGRRIASAAAGQTDGWLRAIDAFDAFPTEVVTAISDHIEKEFRASDDPMGKARMLLFLARRDSTNPLERMTVVIGEARSIGGAPGAQLCLEALDLIYADPPMELDRIDALAADCLEVGPDALAAADAESVVYLYDLLEKHHSDLFVSRDRARFGLALLALGQRSFAREQFDEVKLEELEGPLRKRFASAAAEMLYESSGELQLGMLDCRHQHSLMTASDRILEEWIGLALQDAEGETRYQLLEMQITLKLIAADYGAAVTDFEELVNIAQSFGDRRLDERVQEAAGHLVVCVDRAERWPEAIALTALLRRTLDPAIRDPLFETHGRALVEAHLNQANALRVAGEPASALELLQTLERQWRQNPHGATISFNIAELLVATDDPDTALQYYEQVYSSFTDSEMADVALFSAAKLWMDKGEPAAAKPLLEKLVDEHAASPFANRAAIILYDGE